MPWGNRGCCAPRPTAGSIAQERLRGASGADLAPPLGVQAPKHVVYVLKSAHQPPHYYVGVTGALAERLAHHNAGRCPHTSRYRPGD
jgi:hypothetical protein